MMLNDVEYTAFKMFVTQMSNYLFVISFQLMFYKTLRYRLARALGVANGYLSRVPNTIITDEIVMIKITKPKRLCSTFSFTKRQ